ncbi:hypothetical protein OSR40_012930 [Serratia rubidaea]|uniref:hypothetical protein n=1 Tax=Serratia rubidaea TaxID=61652 RepID=UPI0023AF08C0|nr:hypothetical protein [Serratia rubidaea]MDK1704640.1 hypothetical protein [Serratia rubidaea]
MNDNTFVFDESKYPIAWRFNSNDCLLPFVDKKRIVLLDEIESRHLWDNIFPFNHMIKLPSSFLSGIDKVELDFDDENQSSIFFIEKLKNIEFIFFFWGRGAGSIVPVDVFLKAWSDFFYPSDESSVMYIPNVAKVIYSFEEQFFYADISK